MPSALRKNQEAWLANFNNETPAAKYVATHTKETYDGLAYIPWAVMVVALQISGSPWTFSVDHPVEVVDEGVTVKARESRDKQIVTYESPYKSTVVRVTAQWGDNTWEEVYPIQDLNREASQAPNANLVNRAIKRAMVKAFACASGIGLGLYVGGDETGDETVDEPVAKNL